MLDKRRMHMGCGESLQSRWRDNGGAGAQARPRKQRVQSGCRPAAPGGGGKRKK